MIDSEKIHKNFPKKNRILWVVWDFQIDFLNDSTLFHTFGESILIELAKGFNLRHMRVLRSHTHERYKVIVIPRYRVLFNKNYILSLTFVTKIH